LTNGGRFRYNSRTARELLAMANQNDVSPSSQGWGVAAFIVLLAIVINTVVYRVHQATYLKPDAPKAAAAEH